MSRPTKERLEALVYGELDAAEAAEVERLAAADDDAAAELAWLRTERAMMRERADREPPVPASLWAGVQRAIEAEPARPWWQRLFALDGDRREKARWFGFGLATAAAVAVLMLVVLGPDRPGPSAPEVAVVAPDAAPAPAPAPADGDKLAAATRALDEAELSHLAALDALRDAYLEERDALDPQLAARYDEQFRTARSLIEQARATDPSDLHARRQLLAAYSVQLRTLQSAVIGREEVR